MGSQNYERRPPTGGITHYIIQGCGVALQTRKNAGMYLIENPVLQRELLVNLRMHRAFILLLLYQVLLGTVVYLAWPQDERVDMTANSAAGQKTKKLVDMFFLGQYILASMMAPSFAAATITGEKERKTYEMLL